MTRFCSFVVLLTLFNVGAVNAFPVVEDRECVMRNVDIAYTHDATLIPHDLGGDSVLQFFYEAKYVWRDGLDGSRKRITVYTRDTLEYVGTLTEPPGGYETVFPFSHDQEKYRVTFDRWGNRFVEGEFILFSGPEPKLLGQGYSKLTRIAYVWDEATNYFDSWPLEHTELPPFDPVYGLIYPSSIASVPERDDAVVLPDCFGGTLLGAKLGEDGFKVLFRPLDSNGRPLFGATAMDESWDMLNEDGSPLMCRGDQARGMWISAVDANGVMQRYPLALWATPGLGHTVVGVHATLRHRNHIYFQLTGTPGGLYRIAIEELFDETIPPDQKYYEEVVTDFAGGNDWVGEPVFAKFAPPGSPASRFIVWQRGLGNAFPPTKYNPHPYAGKYFPIYAVDPDDPQHIYYLGEETSITVMTSNSNSMPPRFDAPRDKINNLFLVSVPVQQYAHEDTNPCAPVPPDSWLFAPLNVPLIELDLRRIDGPGHCGHGHGHGHGHCGHGHGGGHHAPADFDPRFCWASNDPTYCN